MSTHLHKTSHKAANNRLIWLHYAGCYAMQDHSLGLRVEGEGSLWGGGENVGRIAWFSGRFVVPGAVTMSMFAQDRGPFKPFNPGFLQSRKTKRHDSLKRVCRQLGHLLLVHPVAYVILMNLDSYITTIGKRC